MSNGDRNVPIYEYECTKCGRSIEAIQKFSDPPLTKCSHCQGRLRKLVSMCTFHLKGTGWYVTDYSGKKQDTTKKKETQKETSDKKATTADRKKSDS